MRHSACFDTGNERESVGPSDVTDCKVRRGMHTLVSERLEQLFINLPVSGYDIVSITIEARATSIHLRQSLSSLKFSTLKWSDLAVCILMPNSTMYHIFWNKEAGTPNPKTWLFTYLAVTLKTEPILVAIVKLLSS